jgi:hypothetical protein
LIKKKEEKREENEFGGKGRERRMTWHFFMPRIMRDVDRRIWQLQ